MSEHQSCSSEPEHFIKDQAHRDRISPSGGKTSVAQSSSGSEEGVTMAEAIAKLREFDRLGLIIESAVRNADGPNWVTVSDLIKRNRVFMSLVGSGCAAQPSPDQRCLEDMTLAHNARKTAIEECARELETSYPDHAWLNAACAAIRALSAVTPSPGPGERADRLEDERNRLQNSYGSGPFADGLITRRIAEIDKELSSLSSTSRGTEA